MIPGAPIIEQLTSSTYSSHISTVLRIPPNTPQTEISYELVRAIAWASTSGRTPISTRSLLDRIMDADAALNDNSVDEQARRQLYRLRLDELALAGDLAVLGRGQWVSSIGSIVHQDDSAMQSPILVSGIPIRVMPTSTQRSLTLHGPTRMIDHVENVQGLGLRHINLDEWARVPDSPLDAWTANMLESPLYRPHEASAPIRVYLPESATSGALQKNRWFPVHKGLTGRYLSRHKVPGGWTEFTVVELDSGVAKEAREVDPLDVRRLMYGLDHRSGKHTVADVRTDGNVVRIRFGNPLPHPEARIMYTLCGLPTQDMWSVRRDPQIARKCLSELMIAY
ncbi:hypothetical protein HCA61_18620 [Rhodococcus sp. HNM0563]|uniref:hypothetical protein n=1 Tax=Rhodococcus sp. HNM0563 TaxID=2716339 RepID=UPI00146F8885|nr:hypothetical protein [Rhodococcus sp. HNM0563]NLU64263.1 hypothetical protein [Rhodococcus sp. HNM0563]